MMIFLILYISFLKVLIALCFMIIEEYLGQPIYTT
jgi:hypothetical protein